jgi:hypothetical protein
MWQFADLLFVCPVCLPFAAFRFADPFFNTSRNPKESFVFAIVERAQEFAELRFVDKKKYLRVFFHHFTYFMSHPKFLPI